MSSIMETGFGVRIQSWDVFLVWELETNVVEDGSATNTSIIDELEPYSIFRLQSE